MGLPVRGLHAIGAAGAAWALGILGASGAAAAAADGGLDLFEKRVRPLLVEHCYECHSAGKKARGGLLVDSRAALLRGGDSGPALVPGAPEASLLVKAVKYIHEDLQMPPKHKLEPEEVAALEAWVRLGAPDPRREAAAAAAEPAGSYKVDFEAARTHWAFQPIADPPPPPVRGPVAAGRAGDVDRFVRARLEARGLGQNGLADRRTLARRVTYDLTGLPPTPDEVEAFARDPRPDAWARLVERLLASPSYGERWGRHWLDVVRYADTAGDSADYPVPELAKYRDYVIDSFNADKPYDVFLREQIAGDLMEHPNPETARERLIATGYIALARRFGVSPVMHLTIEDTIDNLGKGVLGLTIACARCHDHKFDPVTAQDYYALYGIFASTRYAFGGSENNNRPRDFVPLVSEEERQAILAPFRAELEPAEAELGALEADKAAFKAHAAAVLKAQREGRPAPAASRAFRFGSVRDYDKVLRELRKKRDEIQDRVPDIDSAYAVSEGVPRNARVMVRGEPDKLGPEVPRRWLTLFGATPVPPDETGSGRRQLAAWVTDPRNPLVARVMVNRIWQHHFGRGLVPTPNDFGRQGQPPTHPELLDWLAARFRESGYSVKAMHRLILMSRTYRASSRDDAAARAVDPEGQLLWRWPRRRLDAESLRDTLLATSGSLAPRPAGAHPFPPKKTWTFTQHRPFAAEYDTHARSVYVMQQRLKRHSYFSLFDGADPNASTGARAPSTTPLQALYVMNDPLVHEMSERLAARLEREARRPAARVDRLHRLVLGRPASGAEIREGIAFVRGAAAGGEAAAWASYARTVLGSNEAFFLD
jgi:hypothetical protein